MFAWRKRFQYNPNEGISHDNPGISFIIASETAAADLNSEDSFNIFPSKTMTSKDRFVSLETGCFIPKPVQIKELVKRIETELLK